MAETSRAEMNSLDISSAEKELIYIISSFEMVNFRKNGEIGDAFKEGNMRETTFWMLDHNACSLVD